MNRQYYRYGLRPVYKEEKKAGIPRYYAYEWATGEFKEDMSYLLKISNDLSGDAEEISKEEFDLYVKKLKEEKGLK